MRWTPAGCGCALWLVVLTGCPEFHKPGGIIDQAAERDAEELLPKRCSPKERDKFCGKGKEKSKECLRECGE